MVGLAAEGHTEELRRVLTTRDIHCRYQPIVDLETEEVVAYEALARGPRKSQLSMPAALFLAAHDAGLTAALDQLCRSAALEGVAALGREEPVPLFVNIDPASIGTGELFDEQGKELLGSGRVRVTVELAERVVSSMPAKLLESVAWLRERGVSVALDDLGADERSVALMPFVAPDVVKLDLAVLAARTPREAGVVIDAVWAETERTGAAILAEGIETGEDVERALAIGARFGQGWHFGRPEPLPAAPPLRSGGMRTLRRPAPVLDGSPFETISARREPRRANPEMLRERARQLEEEAAALGPSGVLLSTLVDDVSRFGELAFVGAAPADDWSTIVLGPQFAAALVVRGDEFCMTYDRDLVVDAARQLMSLVAA